MNKNKFLYLSSGLLFASIGNTVQGQEAVATTERPNVIYLLCDDMGYSDIEAYGQQMISTPNLTRLVNNGMSFTQFYASTAVSAPSRASLMTGQHTGHTKIRGNKEIQPEGQEPLDPNVETIGNLFQQNGYVTGCFGKWGMGYPGSGGEANDMGFDVFYGYNCQRKAHSYYPQYLWNNKEKVQLGGNSYSQDLIHQEALKFIRDNADKAFFGYFTYTIPHAELTQPQDSIVAMYDGKFYEPNPWYNDGDYGTALNPRTQFAAMITRLDTYVGQIIDELERLGIADKTLFIFTSDNGPHNEGGADPTFFNTEERLRGLKRALYEGGMRVPFIAYWPGTIEAGAISHIQAAGWDMMPTFVELLGEDSNWRDEAMDGLSILPTLTGNGTQQEHEFLYWEFHEENGRQAVRAGDWKLIRQNIKNGNPTHELYNIAEDPHEDNDLAATYPDKVEELKAIMDREHTHSDMFNFGR
ncbi:MAG: arylsulfatase [Bacteroidetes bacterium]|uniref:Arylsulfatase n=1 Tax=Candidatus Caccoplasma merdipullorum TaxID=2840718 RepID=A0A9D9E5P1_9BACT|nr:arylsulfatase [Candidatus Caccoplasma merdipullorum]